MMWNAAMETKAKVAVFNATKYHSIPSLKTRRTTIGSTAPSMRGDELGQMDGGERLSRVARARAVAPAGRELERFLRGGSRCRKCVRGIARDHWLRRVQRV